MHDFPSMNVHWHLPSGVEPDSKPPPPALNSPAPDVHAGLQYPAQASRAFIASPVDVEYPFFLHFFFTFFSFHFFIFLKYFLHGFDFFLSTQSGSFSQASAEELGVGPLEGIDVLSASEGLGVGADVGAGVGLGVGASVGCGVAGQSATPQFPQPSQPHGASRAKSSRSASVHQPRSWSKSVAL